MFTASTELAWMLRSLEHRPDRGPALRRPGLHATLLELRSWIDHPRTYEKRYHETPWRSLAGDVAEVLCTVGPRLSVQAPSLDALVPLMHDDELAASSIWKAECGTVLAAAAGELASPSAAVAAFDDVHAALRDPATPYAVVEALTLHLDAALRFGGRSLGTEAEPLAGVLADDAMSVEIARAVLTCESALATRMPADRAELNETERLALCRDLLRHRPFRGNQVVWLCFENAHCRTPDWILPIGGVTFIDGQALSPALDDFAAGTVLPHLVGRIPVELLGENPFLRMALGVAEHHPDLKEWVWARVELGDEPYVSPLAQARRIAASLVDLAAFHDGGSHWRLMDGGVVLVDGQVRLDVVISRPVDSSKYALRWTSETLGELATELEPHVPAIAEPLLDLLAAARTVQANAGEDSNTAALLIDVQVIELIAKMAGTSLWHEYLRSNIAGTWARTAVLDELIDAYRAPTGVLELRELPEVRAITEHYEHVPGDPRHQVNLRYDLALHRLPAVCDALPAHAPGARRLRTLNTRLSDTTAAGRWIDDLVRQYRQGVDRLVRCRNAIARGGPTNRDVTASLRHFANGQAGRVTSIAIWATVRGQTLSAAHDQPRDRDARWRAALDAPGATTDVLLDTSA